MLKMADTYQVLLFFLLVILSVNARPSIKHRQKRIVGGKPIKEPGKWPWIATLWYNKTHYCGGSIIDKKWIVTTAHCFNDAQTSNEPSDWLVKVGKHDLSKVESHEQCFKVKRIIRHPNYTSMWDTYRIDKPDDNDVALLELHGKIKYSRYARPIKLLRNGIKFHPGHECYIAGWGHTYFSGVLQKIIREVKVKLVSRKKCNSPKSYNGSIHERAICAGYEAGGRDACQYDSGGPLFCTKKVKSAKWYLVGQVSWGDKCALPHKYGVYSNMEALGPWVLRTIRATAKVYNRNG